MKTVTITSGLPGSGKTTWAKTQVTTNPGRYKRINKDDLRSMLDDGRYSRSNEDFILATRNHLIIAALNEGKHVIVDDTNLASTHVNVIKDLITKYNKDNNDYVQVIEKPFTTDLKTCIDRDSKRDNPVGRVVITKMYNDYIKKNEVVEYVEQDDTLPKALIVDIDGTIAEKGDRNPFNWKAVGQDTPIQNVIDLVTTYSKTHKIILLSGRDSICRPETKQWLTDNNVPYNWLYMRPEGSREKDIVIKKQFYIDNIQDKYFIDFILDDRDSVVNMWRNDLHLPCFQVAEGDF
jgi:predicted kinase